MRKIHWHLGEEDGRPILTRTEMPLALWLLDRWFRIPDFVFDRIEWWWPRSSSITKIPCLMYSRWYPILAMNLGHSLPDTTQPSARRPRARRLNDGAECHAELVAAGSTDAWHRRQGAGQPPSKRPIIRAAVT
jgi:hypothetical protein